MHPRHVYVHVPFCARRCSYCDFAIAVRRVVPVADYLTALDRELALRFPDARAAAVDTLYLGGGTPSRLGAAGVARMLDVTRSRFTPEDGAEVTLEANPEDVTAEAARAWRSAGVTRLSLGSQSFDDRVLAWMHRVHDAAAIPRAVDAARSAGFRSLSLDLIFALPAALARDWDRDLREALALAPEHLSLYGLTVEPGTPLGRWTARGEASEAPEERYEAEFLLADEALGAAGFEHYEVSNFARPGQRARHNSAYWARRPYVGIGPGAHEFDGERRRWNVGAYPEWARRLAAGTDPLAADETLSADDRATEEVYLGMRSATGLELAPDELDVPGEWVARGWATFAQNRLSLTPLGWLRLDALAASMASRRTRRLTVHPSR
ncbi:MAG TPA: radical SAM family heme chaperone HemW [Gemmatimonadaceae bacterium]|nr:radical SAM family heme chaperone HemW [Gemmatimonadaceae bacterium]